MSAPSRRPLPAPYEWLKVTGIPDAGPTFASRQVYGKYLGCLSPQQSKPESFFWHSAEAVDIDCVSASHGESASPWFGGLRLPDWTACQSEAHRRSTGALRNRICFSIIDHEGYGLEPTPTQHGDRRRRRCRSARARRSVAACLPRSLVMKPPQRSMRNGGIGGDKASAWRSGDGQTHRRGQPDARQATQSVFFVCASVFIAVSAGRAEPYQGINSSSIGWRPRTSGSCP